MGRGGIRKLCAQMCLLLVELHLAALIRPGERLGTYPFDGTRRRFSVVGITLVELVIALGIVATLFSIAVPSYQNYVQDQNIDTAILDIRTIDIKIIRYQSDNGVLPSSLADVGAPGMTDPWGNPYQYLRIEGADLKGLGNQRKDKNLVPVNSDFDLYSMGPDGNTKAPFTAKAARDDIVRCRNGSLGGGRRELLMNAPLVTGRLLNSKVAWRVFALFLISTVAPVGLLGLLTLGFVSNQLLEQSYRELNQVGKATSTHLYERILVLQRELRLEAKRIRVGTAAEKDLATRRLVAPQLFSTVGLIRADGRVVGSTGPQTSLPVPSQRQRRYLQSGKSVIITGATGAGAPFAFMLTRVSTQDSRIVVGEVNLHYLWEVTETLPFGTGLCALDALDRKLFCSAVEFESILSGEARVGGLTSASDVSLWKLRGVSHMTSEKVLFLESNFLTPHWTVVVGRAKSDALLAANNFKEIFPPVVVLSVLIVVLVSIGLIRRTMIPLERLQEGTRAISIGDFSRKIDVDSADEFEELADSFNDMSSRLERQFTALRTMAAIDRMILPSSSAEHIVDAVLVHLRSVVACDFAAMTLITQEGARTRFEAVGGERWGGERWGGRPLDRG